MLQNSLFIYYVSKIVNLKTVQVKDDNDLNQGEGGEEGGGETARISKIKSAELIDTVIQYDIDIFYIFVCRWGFFYYKSSYFENLISGNILHLGQK